MKSIQLRSFVYLLTGVSSISSLAAALPKLGTSVSSASVSSASVASVSRLEQAQTQDKASGQLVAQQLLQYFDRGEIDVFFDPSRVPGPGAAGPNRLVGAVDPYGDQWNRCGDDYLPRADCPDYQNIAWNNGHGCLTQADYTYAQQHDLAPLCSPLDPTVYIGFCRCGCFEQTTRILSFNLQTQADEAALVSAVKTSSHQVYALTEDSTLTDPNLAARSLEATTMGPEEKPLVWVHLANGVVLGLSTQHAVLLASGEMVTAETLKANDELVNEQGEFVSIQEIQRVLTSDPVYNVLTDAGMEHKGHMIVANGIIVGDIKWQNTLAADLGDIVIRM